MMDQSSQSLGGPLPTILATSSQSQFQQTQSQQTGLPPWDFSSQPPGGFGTPRVRAGSPLRREYRRDSGMAAAVFSSQVARQGTPSQSRPQGLPGLFGARPSFSPFKRSPLKKGKRKSELRMSGFR